MKKILVLGPGCAKCEELYRETEKAIIDLKLEADLTKISDINEIMKYGVMFTPALIVDDQVKVTGKVPTLDELKELIK